MCEQLPKYSPIATFVNGQYPVGQGLAGVLAKCLPDGFEVHLNLQ